MEVCSGGALRMGQTIALFATGGGGFPRSSTGFSPFGSSMAGNPGE